MDPALQTNLLDKLKLGTDNNKLIKWPGTDVQVILKILSEQDRLEASFAAERLFKSEKIDANLMTAEQYDSEKTVQLLYRALRCPDNLEAAICPSISVFRKGLCREDMKMLITEYMGFESECSLSPDNLSQDEFDKLLLEVKKNAATTISSITSMSTLKKLVLFLASQPVNLPQVNG